MAKGKPIKFEGLKEMRAKLANVARKYPKKAKGALVQWGERVMTRSKDEFVPVDLGTLRGSGHVQVHSGNKIGIDLVYGGPAEAYAVVQHENPDFEHEVGEDKYLEKPLLEAASTFEEDMVALAKMDEGDL